MKRLNDCTDDFGARARELKALTRLAVQYVRRGPLQLNAPARPHKSLSDVQVVTEWLRYSASDPKSKPGMDTRSMGWPSTCSMERTIAISPVSMNVNASPDDAARPVRPIRWM